MPDYEKMYKRLFNDYTKIIALMEPLGNALVDLKLAQQESEEIALSEDNTAKSDVQKASE